MSNNNGSWIFISHSSADILKIRMIRNEFEKYGQNPLAFHLKCLNDNTEKNKNELFDLIKREIDAREWFVYCESASARQSSYVKMERDYVSNQNKQFIWMIDLDCDDEEIKNQVYKICCMIQVFIIYSHKDSNIVKPLIDCLEKDDFQIWDNTKLQLANNWVDSVENEILKTAKKGFVLYICTPNSNDSISVKHELEAAKKERAKIITFVFYNVEIASDVYSLLNSMNIYHIPNIPKKDDMHYLVDLIKASLKRKMTGGIEIKADALNAESKLNEKLNYDCNYHLEEPIYLGDGGPKDDYIEIYKFPCCGKIIKVGCGPVSRFRCDGCSKK